jgi:putative DNA primase/helicase
VSMSGPSESDGASNIPPARPIPPQPRLESIPLELRELPQWVLWTYQLNGKKDDWTKVPRQTSGAEASSTSAATWTTFDGATQAYASKRFDGIGLVTSVDDPYVFIDLDDVVNRTTGEVSEWAHKIVTTATAEGAYVEMTPSGEGYHIIGPGEQLSKGRNRNKAEMYSSGRFFTVTGNGSGPTILGTLRETRAQVLRRQDEGKPKTDPRTNGAAHGSTSATESGFPGVDAELLEAARQAGNGDKFSRLFDATEKSGDYKSDSEADAALIALLGFWCGPNAERIERLMHQSNRSRDKWDTTRSTDAGDVSYLRYSIDRWLETPRQFYGLPTAEKPAIRFLAGPDRAILTEAEIAGVPTEPAAVVAGYLPRDCGSKSAQGGTGKTTLALVEGAHIILERKLWGRAIVQPGNVLFITAEDSRETTAYRLNCICTAMGLSAAERERVRRGFFCEDLSDKIGARLVAMVKGEVTATTLADEIIEKYGRRNVSYVHLDPTSLLGPGEASGNDGMSELMRVGRRVSRELRASVRNIHHVSQQVARAGTQDQYVGRGGTAFADNGRFVHQLVVATKRKFTHDGTDYLLPPGATDEAMRRGQILAILIHKVSYMERPGDPIFIRRDGFRYEQLHADVVGKMPPASPGADDEKHIPKIVDYLNQKLADGKRFSASRISDDHCKVLGLDRIDLRRIIDEGVQTGIFEAVPLPRNECRGQKKTFIRPKAGLYE